MQSVQIDINANRFEAVLGLTQERGNYLLEKCVEERKRIEKEATDRGSDELDTNIWLRDCLALCETVAEALFISNYLGFERGRMFSRARHPLGSLFTALSANA